MKIARIQFIVDSFICLINSVAIYMPGSLLDSWDILMSQTTMYTVGFKL